MEKLEIKSIREITEEEAQKHFEEVLKSYKLELKEAQDAKKKSDKEIFDARKWGCVLHASVLGLLASSIGMGLETSPVLLSTLFASLGGIMVSTLGASLTGQDPLFQDKTKAQIKQSKIAAKEAKKQIKELKKKIKETQNKSSAR